MNRRLISLALALAAALAIAPTTQAQTTPLLEFTAATTTGAGSVVPVLTWKTTPAATSCTASGSGTAWTGTKAAAGTQTLAAITSSQDYSMTCTWAAAAGFATVRWNAVTERTDNAALVDLVSYKIYWGPSSADLSNIITLPKDQLSKTITPLGNGTYYFRMTAVSTSLGESALSDPPATKTITTSTASKTEQVMITVNPKPKAPAPTVE
jgi:hypothetical protein